MPLEVKWYDDEHTILVATIAKNTSWTDYHTAVDAIIHEAQQSAHPVYAIFHDEVGMPAGNPMPHLKSGINRMAIEQNLALMYIAGSRGSTGFVRTIMEIIGKTLGQRVMTSGNKFGGFVKTLDEAVAHIKAMHTESQANAVSSPQP